MKLLSKSAFGIFEKLIALMGDNQYIKIDHTNSIFTPISVEDLGAIKGGKLISLAHYNEQNGDFMADPEMVFVYVPGEHAYPISFKNDGLGTYYESVIIENEQPVRYHKAQQADHAYFANQWLKNIKGQQGIL